MDKKLYVGNLPYNITDEKLQEMFAKAGNVTSINLIKDRDSGRSKGFAFIEMGTQVEIEEAIRMYNDFDLEGRSLKVNIARPQEKRGGYGQRHGGGYGDSRRGGGRDRGRGDSKRRY